MSQDKVGRRRFLADVLFAGGALTAAALAAKLLNEPQATPSATPIAAAATPVAVVASATPAPATPSPQVPPPDIHPAGAPMPPAQDPGIRGDAVYPIPPSPPPRNYKRNPNLDIR